MLIKRYLNLSLVSKLGQYQHFGEESLVSSAYRQETAACIEDTELIFIKKDDFKAIVNLKEDKKLLKKTEYMRNCILFQDWSFNTLKYLYLSSEEISVSKGEIVFNQDDISSTVFLIKSGSFSAVKKLRVDLSEKQKIPIQTLKQYKSKMDQMYKNLEVKVYTYSQYGIFGEEDLLLNQNRTFSVVCESFAGELLVIQASEFFNKVMKLSSEVIQTIQKQKEQIFEQSYQQQKRNINKYQSFIIENRQETLNQIDIQLKQKSVEILKEDESQELHFRINQEFHQLKNIDPNVSPSIYPRKNLHSFYRRKMYQQIINKQKSFENPIFSPSKSKEDNSQKEAPEMISKLIDKKKKVYQEKNMKPTNIEEYDDIIEISPRTKKQFEKRRSVLKSPKRNKSTNYTKRQSIQVLENLIKNVNKKYQVNESFFQSEDQENVQNQNENKRKSKIVLADLSVSFDVSKDKILSVDNSSLKNIEKLLKRRDSITTRLLSHHTDASNSQILEDIVNLNYSKDLTDYAQKDIIRESKSKEDQQFLPKIKYKVNDQEEYMKHLKLQIDSYNTYNQKQDKVLQKYLENKNLKATNEYNYIKLSLSQFVDQNEYKQICNQNSRSRYLSTNSKKVNMQSAVWQYNIQQLNKSKQVINQALNNIKIQNEEKSLRRSIPIRISSSLSKYQYPQS
ncbi:cyclic nucleotide-binding domain protein (macronuclear) [Tetrahymena thermophila SB210]|uniref:Cyclic nucleotide-binding domain protein n=1 Tax=Tetrahymena thermophila (strain SB210) TaxID=312017 RepID=W7WWX8_TETTS|nr:cyclic nucleotide-binding domain protein [Tetrahymena thermophila SB210]EWS71295.1 cyclic nucleotide-binding domain protein [Tetrahymena thermophila SB210]|eukprot:XP_012656174.1 cyclic nucleotide-binding domain protein [Tetrahymena thermophila SB210]